MGRTFSLLLLPALAGVTSLACLSLPACGGTPRVVAPVAKIGSAVPSATLAPPTPCELASVARARVPGLLAEGKLSRTLLVIGRANQLCPEQAALSWTDEILAAAELGDDPRVTRLAAEIEAKGEAAAKVTASKGKAILEERVRTFPDTDEARRAMRADLGAAELAEGKGELARAKELYLRAWSEWRPNGPALVGAGLAAKALGDKAEAQRLFDRAIVELERETGKRITVVAAPRAKGSRLGSTPPGAASEVIGNRIAWTRDGSRLITDIDSNVRVFSTSTGRLKARFPEGQSFVLSPDEKLLALGASQNKWAGLGDVENGRPLPELSGKVEGLEMARAFSPDGELLATDTFPLGQPEFQLWRVRTGKLDPVLQGPLRKSQGRDADFVDALAFSPDGKTLAAGYGRPRGVELWDVTTGKLSRTLATKSEGWVNRISFSPDGHTADVWASGAMGGHLPVWHRWDVRTGQLLCDLTPAWRPIQVSPDGRVLIFWKTMGGDSTDITPTLVDARSCKPLRALEGSPNQNVEVSFTPDSTLVAAASPKELRLWNVASGKLLRTVPGNFGNSARVYYSPDSKTLALMGEAGLWLWNVASGKLLWTMKGRFGDTNNVTFSPDSRTLALNHETGLGMWDVGTGKLLKSLQQFTADSLGVAVSPDRKTLAVIAGNTVRLWQIEPGRPLRTLVGTSAKVTSVAFSPDGKTLATGAEDHLVRLWEVDSGKALRTLKGQSLAVGAVSFSADGKTLVSLSRGPRKLQENVATLYSWDVGTGQLLDSQRGASTPVSFARDGRTLVTQPGDRASLLLWRVGGASPPRRLERSVQAFALSPDAGTLAVSDRRGTALVDVASDKVLRVLQERSGAQSFVFSPDGETLAAQFNEGVRLWRLPSGRLLGTLPGGQTPMAFSRDGKTLVARSESGVRLWSLPEGKELLRLYATAKLGAIYAQTPDGYYELSSHEAGDTLGCEVGHLFFPFDLCEERFVVPGLAERVLRGDRSYGEP